MKNLALIASLLLTPMVAACGDDSSTKTTIDAPSAAVDAPTQVDGAPDAPTSTSTVQDVPCVGGEMTIIAVNGTNAFMPTSVTIAVGDAVKFTMPSTHSVVPDTGTDSGLKVGFSTEKCLKFTAAGTYSFHCNPHGFKGTVVVQ